MSARLTQDELRDWLINWVNNNIASVHDLGGADPDRPLEELGLSSRDAVSLVGELEDLLDQNISPTLAWEVPTINRIAEELTRSDDAPTPVDAPTAVEAAGSDDSTGGHRHRAEDADDEDDLIAVVGVGARLPGGVDSPDAYWDLLINGRDAITTVPDGRWGDFIDSTPANDAVLARTTRWGGFLDDVAGFDAEFFGVTPREAESADPQQRLLLEVAWEALEHAGINPDRLRGTSTGVFVGISVSEYSHLTTGDITAIDAWTSTGAALSIAANRISYLLDLRGPSMAIDTACSSSLVALHNACVSLRSHESDHAIVGGVNLLLSPTITANFDLGGVLAADGRCKSFGADADGIVRGEGAGAIVIKRLSDARRDGDRVLAVVRGSAVNSDGRSNGLTAPNPQAQEDVLRAAYAHAGVNPGDVDYVEAHGTGTLLGDPIEAGALGAVLGRQRDPRSPLYIGSAKSNLGHLEAAAGIAGVIKVILGLAHGHIPPTLHADVPNPHIRFERDRLKIASGGAEWPRYSGKALAGVSGFGFGGTNAHVVFEEFVADESAETEVPTTDANAVEVLALAATSPARLADTATALADWLITSDAPLADVSANLVAHRGHGSARAAVVGRTRADLVQALRQVGTEDARVITGKPDPKAKGPVWIFSGFGSQWLGMSAKLITDEPAYAAALSEASALVQASAGFDVLAAIENGQPLANVAETQVAIFCVQIALAALWRSRGVEPAAILGHSMGEVAAAVAAGALSLADGVQVIVERSTLLSREETGGNGGMAVVDMTPDEFNRWSGDFPNVGIAVYAAPTQLTITGLGTEVAALVERVEGLGRDAWKLRVSGAAHSPEVDRILPELRANLDGITPLAPTVPFYSTVLEDPRELPKFDIDYWAANARRSVRFTQAIAAAAADGYTTYIELSPHPIAAASISKTLLGTSIKSPVITGSLRRDVDDSIAFATNLATLRVNGFDVQLGHSSEPRPFLDLPLMVWRNERFWFTPPKRRSVAAGEPFLGVHVELPEGGRHLWSNPIGNDEFAGITESKAFAVTVVPAAFFLEAMLGAGAEAFRVAAARISVTEFVRHNPLTRAPETELTASLDNATGQIKIFGRPSKRVAWSLHASATLAVATEAVPAAPASVVPTVLAAASNLTHNSLFSARAAVLDRMLRVAIWGSEEAPADDIVGSVAQVRVLGDISNGGRLLSETSDGRTSAWLLSDAGEILAYLASAQVRALLRSEIVVPSDELLYRIEFVPAALPTGRALLAAGSGAKSASEPANRWIVVDASRAPSVAPGVVDGLSAGGGDVRSIGAADFAATFAEYATAAQPVDAVVLFAPDLTDAEDADPSTVLDEAQALIRRVGEIAVTVAESGAIHPRVWIVTTGGAGIGDEAGRPAMAALRTAVRVLAIEQTSARTSLVDGDPIGAGADILQELLAQHDDDEVAWRGGQRYVNRLTRQSLPEPLTTAVRDGAYLVTGGLGGLGLEVGQWLAANGASRVILTSRRDADAATAERIAAWGPAVQVVPGDITRPEDVEKLVAAATADGVELRGVFHLAGAPLDDALYADLTPEALAITWNSKVRGAWNLHKATQHLELDWFLSFSSVAAAVGSPGQISYGSANAWLDAFATWQRAHGVKGRSINWGAWMSVGGAAENTNILLDAITPAEALEAMEVALGTDQTRTVITLLDPPRVLALLPGLAAMTFFSQLPGITDAQADDGADWPGLEAVLSAEPGVGAAILTARLRDRVAAVMGSTAEDLDVSTPLIDMGFDSLMATRAKNAVEHDLGLAMPVRLVLQGATLIELAAHLGAELGVDMSAITDGGANFASANASMPGNTNALQLRPDGASTEYIPPRDPTERFLVLIWQEALDRKPVGVNEDFYALGGDAALADQVATVISDRLGVIHTAEELFALPTIAEMSDVIREELEGNKGSAVRILRGTGSRTPLFLFHPAGGPTSVYQPMVSMLDEDQPVYGMERIGDADSIEAKVERYIPLIREIQPHGPYRLMGWSFGGVLAGETAYQLEALGEQVDFIARIDTIIPLIDPDQELNDLLVGRYQRFAEYILETYDKVLDIPYDDLPNMTEDEHIAIFRDALTSVGVGMPPGVLEHQYTSYVDARIAERYQPKLFNGRMILYRASLHEAIAATIDPRYRRTDEKLGWDEYSTNMEVIRVPGDHISMIDRPNVDAIAAHLDMVLAALAAKV